MSFRTKIAKTCMAVMLTTVPIISTAQWSGSSTERLNTLRMIVEGDWERPPVVDMTADETIEFSFDEMSHQYRRFTYRIQHCNAMWEPSDILESEYLDGFNDQPIDDWENSLNTTFDYTHYRLTIPNDEVKLKLSGNYRLSVCEDGREVAYFKFCLSEGMPLLSASVTDNTDIDTRESHQQVGLEVNYSSLRVRDHTKDLYTVVMQNGRTDNAVLNPTPTYNAGNKLTYEHCRELIFLAGNEFRRFEIVNMYDYFMNVDRIAFHDPFYHATLMQDTRRHAYKFDHDHNGRYLIRYNQAGDNDTEADYLFVHFNLASERLTGGRMYVYGHFSGGNLTTKYEMEYNLQERAYQASILLKQGAYDYQYLWVPDGETAGETKPAEGDWYETGNEYLILLYYRERGSRYDRLVSQLVYDSNHSPG
ncbi:MAG: DUF5103 domain-containing protein [Bacteroidaceae bacterium]|nr:DUF5103 domain-containing protein [Bacteroidaceae bacterium]